MKNPPLLLIVDDDKDFQEVLATKFKASGFDVAKASDGGEGVARAKELNPDLILMDVKMPKVDGIAAMMKLRESAATKDIKIFLLTAFGDPQPEIFKTDKKLAEGLGAMEYILKSEDLEEIVRKVKEFLKIGQ